MLACQGSKRDKYTDVISFNIGSPDCGALPCVSGATLSILSSICLGGETVLADWLIYYIQDSLSVKDFVRPISKFVLFLSDNLDCCPPDFWAESELYAFAIFCQGFFRNSAAYLFSRPLVGACDRFVPDSEAQLYASRRMSQEVIVIF